MKRAYPILAVLVLTACAGSPVSGIYVASNDVEVDMVQLVETPDHHITGRFQTTNINTDGTTTDNVVALDGAASGSEMTLLLKPIGFINAGVTATGQVIGDDLTLNGRGLNTKVHRQSLGDYQIALDKLKKAAGVKLAEVQAQKAAQAARDAANAAAAAQAANEAAAAANAAKAEQQAQTMSAVSAKIVDATAVLERKGGEMDTFVASLPDIASEYRANTERMADAHGDFAQAKGIIEDTNTIRSKKQAYGKSLTDMVQTAAQTANALQTICGDSRAATLGQSCGSASSAVAKFRARIERYKKIFAGFDAAYNQNMGDQVRMIRSMRPQG